MTNYIEQVHEARTGADLLLERAREGARLLRDVAGDCDGCAGAGEVSTLYEAHLMSDDPRLHVGHGSGHRAVGPTAPPVAETLPRGAGFLRTPCKRCAPLRQVIELLGKEE